MTYFGTNRKNSQTIAPVAKGQGGGERQPHDGKIKGGAGVPPSPSCGTPFRRAAGRSRCHIAAKRQEQQRPARH
jgi:hypothetical protein